MSEGKPSRGGSRLPAWLTKRLPADGRAEEVSRMLAGLGVQTVCTQAHCPNQAECFGRRTATFLILGDRCTRNCRFCAIRSAAQPTPPRAEEPDAVAEACEKLELRHVVITSVARDDLPDGGAWHFARTVQAVRSRLPEAVLEVLTPDFGGDVAAVDTVLAAGCDVFNHNVETVPRLYPQVRPEAGYRRSLYVLDHAKRTAADRQTCTKSGLMVGLGETPQEVRQVMGDLRRVGCDMLTIGQYLAPSPRHAAVVRYVEPDEFAVWEQEGREMGFAAVAAGPFVRSSYHAESIFQNRRR